MGLLNELKNTTLNILNQNQDLMPSEKEIESYVPYFQRVTMTLAFKSNENIEFSYLTQRPIHVGAFFEGAIPVYVPYDEKEDLCIISPDENPIKGEIVTKLRSIGIVCYEDYPIPFPEFVKLQQRAKWTISFGEGWDGYTVGQFRNGGIGFGVYQPNFHPIIFDRDNLPPFLFDNYEQMEKEIVGLIKKYDNKILFEQVNKETVNKIYSDPDANTLENVKRHWMQYYKSIGLLTN